MTSARRATNPYGSREQLHARSTLVVEAYQHGASVAELAKRLGCSRACIHYALKKAGLRLRPARVCALVASLVASARGRTKARRNDAIRRTYARGDVTMAELGERHGITKQRVAEILRASAPEP